MVSIGWLVVFFVLLLCISVKGCGFALIDINFPGGEDFEIVSWEIFAILHVFFFIYYFFRDGKSNGEPTNWTRLPGQVNQ